MSNIDHYENFPVASWLCPPKLRPAVQAIYRFARTADDLADEGEHTASDRLTKLSHFRHDLTQAFTEHPHFRRPDVFVPLHEQVLRHQLPAHPLFALLDAFEQDVRYNAEGRGYSTMSELMDYCGRSANPVGRLMLHLFGVNTSAALTQSDAICSALQLINFWQDLSIDLSRGRYYLPEDWMERLGVQREGGRLTPDDRAAELVLALADHARQLMIQGAPLAWQLPGRIGWELRLVVHGGLRILDKITSLNGRTWAIRPTLNRLDYLTLLWRACLPPPSSPVLSPNARSS
jgi:squalene synthase HpnC